MCTLADGGLFELTSFEKHVEVSLLQRATYNQSVLNDIDVTFALTKYRFENLDRFFLKNRRRAVIM